MVLVQTNYIPFQRKLSSPDSLSFSLYQMLQLLNHHCGLSLDLLQFVHVLLALVSPSLNPALWVCLISAEQRERITSRDLQAILFLMQPEAVGFLCHKGRSLGYIQFVHHEPQILLCRIPFQGISLHLVLEQGVIPSYRQYLALPFTVIITSLYFPCKTPCQ